MIVEGRSLAFKNVISKYYEFESKDYSMIIEDFTKRVVEDEHLTPNGPLFYTVLSELGVEPVVGVFYIPVKENKRKSLKDKEMNFQTYFLINHMIMTRIPVESQEQGIDIVVNNYSEMIDYMYENKMEMFAPFHNVLKIVGNQLYVEVYLGATRIFEDENKFLNLFSKIKKRFLEG